MPSFCSEPGCAGLALTGKFCDSHKADNYSKRRMRPECDRWYSLAAWCGPYGVRGYKLRTSPMCETPDCGKMSTDVHHTKDWKETRDWFVFMGGINMEFLQALCHECHSRITLKEIQKCRQA